MIGKDFTEEAKDFVEKAKETLLTDLEKIRENFLEEITMIMTEGSENFRKRIYEAYSQVLKKLQSANMEEFQMSLNARGGKSESQFLIDLAGIIFKITNV